MTELEPEKLEKPEIPPQPSLAREVVSGLGKELRSSLRWAAWGAGLGAVVFGSVGFWYFGTNGLVYGAGLGAALGGLAVWYFGLSI